VFNFIKKYFPFFYFLILKQKYAFFPVTRIISSILTRNLRIIFKINFLFYFVRFFRVIDDIENIKKTKILFFNIFIHVLEVLGFNALFSFILENIYSAFYSTFRYTFFLTVSECFYWYFYGIGRRFFDFKIRFFNYFIYLIFVSRIQIINILKEVFILGSIMAFLVIIYLNF
jgi:hypothetical protein